MGLYLQYCKKQKIVFCRAWNRNSITQLSLGEIREFVWDVFSRLFFYVLLFQKIIWTLRTTGIEVFSNILAYFPFPIVLSYNLPLSFFKIIV